MSIAELLGFVYGSSPAEKILPELLKIVSQAAEEEPPSSLPLNHHDVVLICYGDSLLSEDASPLQTLAQFCKNYLHDCISAVHVLPFNPYTSDDGFSVSDYLRVNPKLGKWDDFSDLSDHFSLMFDLVLNHCSQKHQWFQSFLAADPAYKNYFIEVDPQDPELEKVFRPRALPLTHRYQSQDGFKDIWTTFSEDQVDVNFANPRVLLEFVAILAFYLKKGFRLIRLDAVGFLWKELGTACMHHEKTHAIIKLLRLLACRLRNDAVMITETNVAHADNVSYFGNGHDEAHMVYQFALPPLTLDAFLRGDARTLQRWASELNYPSPSTTFFNFLASHDGIGLLAAHDYLSQEEIQHMLEQVEQRGGYISYKDTPTGKIPYELNISYFEAVAEKTLSDELRCRKYISSQAIMLAMAGVPGIYIHSLLATPNWLEGVAESGIKRRINRKKIQLSELERQLQNPAGLSHRVFEAYCHLLKVRSSYSCFSPNAKQQVVHLHKRLFSIMRGDEGQHQILCLTNVSDKKVMLLLAAGHDLLGSMQTERQQEVELEAYQTMWWLQN